MQDGELRYSHDREAETIAWRPDACGKLATADCDDYDDYGLGRGEG